MAPSRLRYASLIGLALAGSARAQVDAQRVLRDGGDWLLLHDAAIGAPWTGAGTLSVSHAGGLVRSVPAVAGPRLWKVTTRELGASIVLGEVMEVGLSLPHHGSLVVGTQRPDGHLGDVGMWATVPAVDVRGVRVAVAAAADLGNGLNSLWLGDPAAVETLTATELALPGPWAVAASGGWRWQRRVELPRGFWGSAWVGGVGVHLTPWGPLVLGAEVAGRRPLRRIDVAPSTTPAEALATAGLRLSSWATLTGAGGAGLGAGIGAPAWRVLGSLDVRSRARRDRDHDGVEDLADRCPTRPEDRDGVRDDDGCPDPDPPPPAPLELPPPPVPAAAAPAPAPAPRPAPSPLADPPWQVRFPTGSASIVGDEPALLSLLDWLDGHPEVLRLQVVGSADGQGEETANRRLSERRAEAVVAWLIERGVAPDRLEPVGQGVVSAETDAEARRVRFAVERLAPAAAQGG